MHPEHMTFDSMYNLYGLYMLSNGET